MEAAVVVFKFTTRLSRNLYYPRSTSHAPFGELFLRSVSPSFVATRIIFAVYTCITMATILRSSKYVRNFAEFATKLPFGQIKADPRVSLLSHRNLAPSSFSKSLATQVATQQLENESNLENALRKLDNNVKRYGRISRSQLEHTLNVFQSSKSITSTQALMVIRCCGNLVFEELPESRSELVNQVWKSLENSGIQLDLSHYNALLRVYIENEYAFSPTEVLAELERKGIEPNKLTYQRLINRYCQQGDIEGASKILEFMREKEISVNENIFTALVRGHAEANDMVSAADILSVMRQAGLEPSADTYKELLCGYAKHGDMESITNTLSECKAKNVHLLDTDFLDIIFSLASNGHGAHIESILSIMPKEVGYAPDALSNIFKLIHAGQVDVAMQVLSSIPNREKGITGASIIKQLAKADLPLSKILEICKQIQSKGIHSRALLIGLEVHLREGNVESSLAFLQALKDSNMEVREHYFWPIFVALERSNNIAGIHDLLRNMRSEYNLQISAETLRDYVIPHEKGEPHQIISELRTSGLTPGLIAPVLVQHLINQMKIKEAADFVSQHTFHYNPATLCRPLVTALAQTKDVESFTSILHYIYRSEFEATKFRKQTNTGDQKVLEPFIVELAACEEDHNCTLLTKVLRELQAAGFSISETGVSRIQQIVGNRSTPDLNRLLKGFGSTTSGYVPVTAMDLSTCLMEIERLEESLTRSNVNDEITINTKKRLLYLYGRVKDLPNLEKLATDLKEQGVQFTDVIYKQLVDTYINSDVLDKAEEYLTQLRQIDPNYVLSNANLIKYISLLVKNNRLDDALQFLKEPKNLPSRDSGANKNFSWRLLNAVAEMGEAQAVNAIFETLSQNEYIEISSVILTPLIKVHVVRDDVKEALNVFEKICETYQYTPFKNELTKKLIQAEDANALQRLTDLSTEVHGESNSLYDLAQSFIESDCLRQAKKILEIPALHPKFHKLQRGSRRYSEYGMTIYLERLITVIKDIPYFKGIPSFYEDLLNCYDKENNWEKALNLAKQMEEEEVDPSDAFLVTLAKLLQRNNQPVTFTVPQNSNVPIRKKSEDLRTVKNFPTRQRKDNEDYNSDVSPRQVDRAKHTREETELIESLVQSGQIHEAFEKAQDMVEKGIYPLYRTFKFMARKGGQAGKIESLEKLGKHLPPFMKKIVDFDNNLCFAYVAAGKAEEYLVMFEKNLEETDASDPNKPPAKFPMLGIVSLLKEQPQFIERFTQLAEKHAARGNILPINALWIHYFIHEQPQADKIWSEYLITAPRVLVNGIVSNANRNSDANLLKRLMKTLETSPLTDDKTKGYVYSELIKITHLNGQHEESVDILQEALKVVPADHIQQSVLEQIKSYLESKGLALPADIFPESQAPAAREQLTT